MLPLPPVWISLALALAPVRAPVAPPALPRASRPAAADTLFSAAAQALEQGRPWEASRLIAPVLADSARRTPAALMLAATAASRWNGWREVVRLLDGQPWLDSVPDGRARLLLARGALETGADSAALRHALAVPASNVAALDGARQVTLALALERLGARDSAARTYARAAEVLPAVGGWLRVRAAAVTDDSAARARLYEAVTDALPHDRIGWSEAAAHRGVGDLNGAAARYQALGARAIAARLRFEASPDSAHRRAVRRDLMALVAAKRSPAEVRDAIALLDSAYAPLTPAEELEVGRAAGSAGSLQRAADGYQRALMARLGTGDDRFAFATVLTRLGRNGEAATQFALVRGPKPLEASAAYQRARAMVRDGQLATGRLALERVARRYPHDTSAASTALFLLGDLATDDRADSRARDRFRTIVVRYPTSRFAPTAAFRGAMIALVAGDAAKAAAEFDTLARRYSRSDEASAAAYWAGRAWRAAGDTTAARERWEILAAGDPASYYTGLASRRLDRSEWVPPAALDTFVAIPAADSVMERAALLARLGLAAESRWEYDRLLRQSDTSAERLLALAAASGATASRRRPSSSPAGRSRWARPPTRERIDCCIR